MPYRIICGYANIAVYSRYVGRLRQRRHGVDYQPDDPARPCPLGQRHPPGTGRRRPSSQTPPNPTTTRPSSPGYRCTTPLGTGHAGNRNRRRRGVCAPDSPATLLRPTSHRPPLRDQLIRGYLPVAEHLARRYAGRGEPLDDLSQIATIGLINAIDRFEPDRGSHFLAFAVPTITGELRRYFRDHSWSTHVPRRLKDLHLAIRSAQAELSQQRDHPPRPSDIADHLAVSSTEVIDALHAAEAYKSFSLDEMLHDGQATPAAEKCLGRPDIQIKLVDDRETLRPLLAELGPRERTILMLRFFHHCTQAQIAQHIGVTQMQVSRLLRHILTFLHHRATGSPHPVRPPQPATTNRRRATRRVPGITPLDNPAPAQAS
jgi:RNA polymerase sigma-B factor